MRKWRVWCEDDTKYVEAWSMAKPTLCPENGAHVITAAKTCVVDDACHCEIMGINEQTGTSYTAVFADTFKLILCTNAAAFAFTIDPESSEGFSIGAWFYVEKGGAGDVTLTEGAGVTINGDKIITSQYTRIKVIKKAANVWHASAGAVMETDFDEGTFLYATSDDTPEKKTPAEVRTILQAASYADFYIDASDFVTRTTNGAAAATEETGTNDRMLSHFLFDPGTEEAIQRKFKMPDDWDLGTIKIKVDWDGDTGATAGDVVLWGVKGVAIGDNEDLDGAWGAEVEVSDVLLQNDGGKMQTSAATGAITIGGTPALGKMIWLQLARKAGDASDTMDGEDAKGFGITIQYGVLATTPAAW